MANGNGFDQPSIKTIGLWAGVILSVVASAVNTAIFATNPMGERVKALETDMVQVKTVQTDRAVLWIDVGEIKSDMRWLRQAVSELKDDVKGIKAKP